MEPELLKAIGTQASANLMEQCFMFLAEFLPSFAPDYFNGRAKYLHICFTANFETAQAIKLVKHENLLAEGLMLSRAYVERIVNLCYAMCCEESEYKNFTEHYPLQKAYRSLNRTDTAGQATIKTTTALNFEPQSLPELQEALKRFTSQNGREITHWTKKSIHKIIEYIGENSGVNVKALLLAVVTIYSDASEALHGTFYGCILDLIYNHSSRTDEANEALRLATISFRYWTQALATFELIQLVLKLENVTDSKVTDKMNEAAGYMYAATKLLADAGYS